MTVAVRVIPCLDVSGGRVVKGVHFKNLRDAGDPVELAARYDAMGADEITFLDVSASVQGRGTLLEVVRRTAEQVFIPLTVGGGVRSVEDVRMLLEAGADKVGINTAAIARPELLREVAHAFGNQVIVLSVDARSARIADNQESGHCGPSKCSHHPRALPSGYEVTTHGGQRGTGIDAIEWAKKAVDLGAGEILLNSMDADGTEDGFDLRMLRAMREAVNVPIIASGGAGKAHDFTQAAVAGADAVLAASVFHFGTLSIRDVKEDMRAHGIEVR